MPKSFDQRNIDESLAYAKKLQAVSDKIGPISIRTEGVSAVQAEVAKKAMEFARCERWISQLKE